MKNSKAILSKPYTFKDIEEYYFKTKSDTLKVLLSISTDNLFNKRDDFNRKLSEMIIGTDFFENLVSFTVKGGEKDNHIIIEVVCNLTPVIKEIEATKIKQEEEIALEKENLIFQEKMLKVFEQNTTETIFDYHIRIDIDDSSNDPFREKLNILIEKYEIELSVSHVNRNDSVTKLSIPLWFSFENISQRIKSATPLLKPKNMKNIVEFVGFGSDKKSYYFKVYAETKIESHEWFTVLAERYNKNSLNEKSIANNILPSIKGSFDIELIISEMLTFEWGGVGNFETREDYNIITAQKPIPASKRARLIKIAFTSKEESSKVFYDSMIDNLNRIINRNDHYDNAFLFDTTISLPRTPFNNDSNRGKVKLLGFSKNIEPIFMCEYHELTKIKGMFTGGANKFNDDYPDRLMSLLPRDLFEIIDISEI